MNVCQLQCDTRLNRCPNRTPHVPGLVESVLCQPSMAEAPQGCTAGTPAPKGALVPAPMSENGLAPVPRAAKAVVNAAAAAVAAKLPQTVPKGPMTNGIATRAEKMTDYDDDEEEDMYPM